MGGGSVGGGGWVSGILPDPRPAPLGQQAEDEQRRAAILPQEISHGIQLTVGGAADGL